MIVLLLLLTFLSLIGMVLTVRYANKAFKYGTLRNGRFGIQDEERSPLGFLLKVSFLGGAATLSLSIFVICIVFLMTLAGQ